MIRTTGRSSEVVRRVFSILPLTACVSVASATDQRAVVPRDPEIPAFRSSVDCPLLSLTLSSAGDDSLLSWGATPDAQGYCVERGDLAILRATGGDFRGSLRQELASNTTATSLVFSGSPEEGEGYWFLVKDHPEGTFDSGCPSQFGSRDFEILSAGDFCVN